MWSGKVTLSRLQVSPSSMTGDSSTTSNPGEAKVNGDVKYVSSQGARTSLGNDARGSARTSVTSPVAVSTAIRCAVKDVRRWDAVKG